MNYLITSFLALFFITFGMLTVLDLVCRVWGYDLKWLFNKMLEIDD